MDKKEFQEWLQDNLKHEDVAAKSQAWQACLDNIDHPRLNAWVANERLKVRQELLQCVVDDNRASFHEVSLSYQSSVYTRVMHKITTAL